MNRHEDALRLKGQRLVNTMKFLGIGLEEEK